MSSHSSSDDEQSSSDHEASLNANRMAIMHPSAATPSASTLPTLVMPTTLPSSICNHVSPEQEAHALQAVNNDAVGSFFDKVKNLAQYIDKVTGKPAYVRGCAACVAAGEPCFIQHGSKVCERCFGGPEACGVAGKIPSTATDNFRKWSTDEINALNKLGSQHCPVVWRKMAERFWDEKREPAHKPRKSRKSSSPESPRASSGSSRASPESSRASVGPRSSISSATTASSTISRVLEDDPQDIAAAAEAELEELVKQMAGTQIEIDEAQDRLEAQKDKMVVLEASRAAALAAVERRKRRRIASAEGGSGAVGG